MADILFTMPNDTDIHVYSMFFMQNPSRQWQQFPTISAVPISNIKCNYNIPDSKVHVANMGPTWVLSAPDGPQVVPMNLAIGDHICVPFLICFIPLNCQSWMWLGPPLLLYLADRAYRAVRCHQNHATLVGAMVHSCDVIELQLEVQGFRAKPGQVRASLVVAIAKDD